MSFNTSSDYLAQCPVIDWILTGRARYDSCFYPLGDGKYPEHCSNYTTEATCWQTGVNWRVKLKWPLQKCGRMSMDTRGSDWSPVEGERLQTSVFHNRWKGFFKSNRPSSTYVSHGWITCDPPACYEACGNICYLRTYYKKKTTQ